MAKPNTDLNTEASRNSLKQGMVGEIDRPGFASIYDNLKAGGAFDAKSIVTKAGEHATLVNSLLHSKTWTPQGFIVKQQPLQTEYNNMGGSAYLKGHSTRKYKP
jgi:hypothetical protein